MVRVVIMMIMTIACCDQPRLFVVEAVRVMVSYIEASVVQLEVFVVLFALRRR